MILVCVILLFASESILHAEIQTGSFDFDGHLRNYIVYLPNNYTGTINFPLVIHLHSGGWTAQQDMDYIKLNQVADSRGFIVVYPNAIDKRWNSGGRPAPDVDDVGFINALIDIMSDHYSIDLERIYACGYSRGGFMAYTLACQLSHRIAAIASVSGVLSTSTAESCSPLRTMPVLHIHGTADTWVPINGGSGIYSADQTLSYWTSFNDCGQVDTIILPDLDPTDGCTVEKTTYTNCSDNSNVVYYKVINGGHTWPGAGPPGYAAGKTNQDINASVEIWNFFKNYTLLTPPVVDFNGDGIVDFRDFSMLAQYWCQDQSPLVNHRVDCKDLAALSEYWLTYPGAVAHWKLDETEGFIARDSVGDHDGFVLSANPLWRPSDGMINGALELDGTDDVVSVPFVLDPADGAFSVFAWIKGGAAGGVILSQIGAADWLLADAEGKLMTELKGTGRFAGPLRTETVITDGQWRRVGLTWDGSNRILYVDDVEAAKDTQSSLAGSQGGLYIGAGKDRELGSLWSGLIDDIKIYDRAIVP
jgi:polyhydroxybutyrate depolymerase